MKDFVFMKTECLLLFIFSIFSLIACNKEEDLIVPRTPEELNQLLLQEMNKDNIPSLAACIVTRDSIVWKGTFGYRDPEMQEEINLQTTYLLASISKTFTAVAALQLYEKGLLDLEADINNYLPVEIRNPHFPEVPITTRMLLTHTSGLAWPLNTENPRFNDPYPGDSAPALDTWIKDYLIPGEPAYLPITWKETVPGSNFQYTNVGVALLGYLIAEVSGQNFADYCREHIFIPLEMPNSGFRLANTDPSKLVALYHEEAVIDQYSVPHYPASNVRSSLEELSHFLLAIMNGGVYRGNRILEERTVEEMLNIKLPGINIGFIWQWVDNHWVGHNGGYWGVTSTLDFHPDHGVGVILLTNTNGKESLYSGGEIYRLIHREAMNYAE